MSDNPQIYVGMAILFLAIAIIAFFFSKKKHHVNKRIELALKPYSQADLQDVVFPDGVGGLVDIERLVLLKQGILLIETYPISGNLFGADKIEKWTQMFNGKSFKFTNPLYRIQMLRQAVKAIAPNTPIFYRVIFTANDSSFPKGKPDDVSTLLTLENDLENLEQAPMMTEKQRSNWDRILRIARKDGQAINLGTVNG